MARPVRHTGSGRMIPIPDAWSTDHEAVIAGTLTSMVIIRPASGPPAWNTARGQTETPVAVAAYMGPASITAVAAPGLPESAGELVPTRIYEVRLPYDVDTAIPGLVVDVTASPDPMLVGQRLHVDHTDRGDRRFSRVLLATLAR